MTDAKHPKLMPSYRVSRRTGSSLRLMMAALTILGIVSIGADESGAIDPLQLLLVPLGSPAPDFSLPAIQEQTPGLSSVNLNGDVSIVNVFASWCAPCRLEHALLMDLAEKDVVPIYGLNYKDEPASARRWLEKLGNPYARIGSDRDGRVAEEWDLFSLPQTYVIDQTGRTAYVHTGVLDQSVIDETILPLIDTLKAEAAAP